MKTQTILAEIIRNGEIKLLPSERGGGLTREVHVAEHDGQKYIVRICADKKLADKYVGIYRKLARYGVLPKLLEQEGKYLLFEYLKGRDLREGAIESSDILKQVGRIAALVNTIPAQSDPKAKAEELMKEVIRQHIIDSARAQQVKTFYETRFKGLRFSPSLDANDVTADNFRLSNGQVYFVDIEAIQPKVRGFGIAKAFTQWFKEPAQRRAFRQGYETVRSMNFFNGKYSDFCYFGFLMQALNYRSRKGEDCTSYIKRLDKLLAGEEL